MRPEGDDDASSVATSLTIVGCGKLVSVDRPRPWRGFVSLGILLFEGSCGGLSLSAKDAKALLQWDFGKVSLAGVLYFCCRGKIEHVAVMMC